jgi:ABC-2 type transport system ATP-binding protein
MDAPAIAARGLRVVYRPGVFQRPRVGLAGLDLEVGGNEVFGYVGANGAGKTTTIKALVGLLEPDAGTAEILGRPSADPAARAELGYAPENPYFYEYLTARETLDFYARLFGIARAERRRRAGELLEAVGLSAAADRRVRQFSKGMVQRLGLAQAMVNDPRVLILDEPMTGLDPVGRHDVRRIILDLTARGKTVFFSSHILSDVEALCDRAAIVHDGALVSCGRLDELLSERVLAVELTLAGASAELERELAGRAIRIRREGGELHLTLADEAAADGAVRRAVAAGAAVRSLVRTRESLEDRFIRVRAAASGPAGAAAGKEPGS